MSPRTGRPTDNPKVGRMEIRVSEEDQEKLEYCAKVLDMTKAEVIRQGIDAMYQKALEQK